MGWVGGGGGFKLCLKNFKDVKKKNYVFEVMHAAALCEMSCNW